MLFGHYVLAGILVSLAASFASFLLLYRIAEKRLGADGARRAVLYLAVFPMALFLQAVYSESLYLLLTLAAFLLAERRRFLAAGAVTGLALLTRSTAGIALLPALALLAWHERDRGRALLSLAVAPPIFAAYPLLLWIAEGDAWAFLHAQRLWHRHLSPVGPLGGIWDGLRAGWAGVQQLASGSHAHVYWTPVRSDPIRVAAINLEYLAFLALFVVLTVIAWRRFGAPYGLFAAFSLALPLSVPSERWPLLSIPRFGLAIFPLFLALAVLGGRPRAHTAIVAVSALPARPRRRPVVALAVGRVRIARIPSRRCCCSREPPAASGPSRRARWSRSTP